MKGWNLGYFIVTVTMVTINCTILATFYTRLPPEVPLWYSRPWGESQLTGPGMLAVVPGMVGLVGGLGMVGARKLAHDEVVKVVVYLSSISIQAIMTLALVRIIVMVA